MEKLITMVIANPGENCQNEMNISYHTTLDNTDTFVLYRKKYSKTWKKAVPVINKVDFNLDEFDHALCIVDTGGNHADLTDDYAAIRLEMNSVAEYLGKSVLREVEPSEVFEKMGEIRKKTGDRALERAIHFYNENSRVERLASALDKKDFDEFKSIIIEYKEDIRDFEMFIFVFLVVFKVVKIVVLFVVVRFLVVRTVVGLVVVNFFVGSSSE